MSGSGTIGCGDMTMQTTDYDIATPHAAAEAVVDLDAVAHNVAGCCASMPDRRR